MSRAIRATLGYGCVGMPRVFASRARPTTPWRGREAGEDYGRTAEPSWRDVDWPAHLHRVEIGGVDVNYGETGMPRERITIQGYGRLVEALRARLELDRVVLVGNSMGGFVSSEVAIQ